MKRRIYAIILSLCFFITLMPSAAAATNDDVPDGYVPIYDALDLADIVGNMSGKYILMNDIDLTEALSEGGDLYDSQYAWIALGYSSDADSIVPFTGVLDGDGHSIIGLQTKGVGSGLIYKNEGTICNLSLLDGSIVESKGGYAGAICTYNYGVIDNCFNSNNVSENYTGSNSFAGGIVGLNAGTIVNCGNNGEISVNNRSNSAHTYGGGISGCCKAGTEKRVWNGGIITVTTSAYSTDKTVSPYAGGISGQLNDNSAIVDAYNYGNVTAKNEPNGGAAYYVQIAYSGGIVGSADNSHIENTYNRGEIISSVKGWGSWDKGYYFAAYSGGLIGKVSSKSSILNCYYLNISSKAFGENSADIPDNAKRLSDGLMKRQAQFSGFDFENIWEMGDANYPYPVFQPVHIFRDKIIEPTCTERGYTLHSCSDDPTLTYTDTYVDALGHDCSTPEVIKKPTCTEAGQQRMVCSRCGETIIEEMEPLGHSTIMTNNVSATCMTDGYSGDLVCQVCGEIVQQGEVIPATGHKTELKNDKAATCTTDGYTGDEICSTCGEIVKQGEVIKATGHKTELKNDKAATCTTDGYTGDEICSTCGEIVKQGEVIKATGHKTELKNDKAATCTEDGYTGDEICSTCGETVNQGTVIKAAGHKWDDGKVTKQPTEVAEGTKTFTCTICGETRTESIPKLTPPAPTNPFVDVIAGKYYYDAVLWAVNHDPQITKGVDNTHFKPNAPCTRGEVVTFLWRAMGKPAPTKTDCPFTDVNPKGFYYKAVLWAVENGITTGTSATTFGPNEPCTRGHVVTFLYRAKKAQPVSIENKFTDLNPKGFYYKAVLWAVANDITQGTTKTTFEPGKPCTRGQIVTFLYRSMK